MKKIILILLAALLVFAIFIFLFFNKNTNNGDSPSFITPTPIEGEGGNNAVSGFTNDNPEKNRQEFLVGKLIEKLPYSGANFSLYYDFSKNQFILYVNPSASSEGNAEFDAFLKQNGVESRSWIKDLVSTNTKTTPVP